MDILQAQCWGIWGPGTPGSLANMTGLLPPSSQQGPMTGRRTLEIITKTPNL